jgi:hypothetical protein
MSLHLVADMQANYSRFVNRVRSSGTVWGLKILNGWAICPSNERDCDVYTFWSDNAYAERHCNGPWANYKPALPSELAARIATRRALGRRAIQCGLSGP